MLLPLGNVIEKLTAGLDVGHQLGMLGVKLPLHAKIVHTGADPLDADSPILRQAYEAGNTL